MIKYKFFRKEKAVKVILWSNGEICERVLITDGNLESIKLVENIDNNVKVENLFIVVDTPDFFETEINIPEGSDKKIKDFIIKKKLSEVFTEEEFFIAYDFKRVGTVKVFALPKSVISEILKNYQLSKLSVLTNIPMALSVLAEKILPEKSVLIAYIINNRFYLILSKNKEIEFVRIISIPESLETKEEKLNFVYENLQTTYFFLNQRERKKIDLILLSGKFLINFKEDLKEKFNNANLGNFKFIDEFFDDIELMKDVLSDYTPCIGALFVDYKFNFIPYEIIRERNIKKFLLRFLLILSGLFMILLSFASFKFNSIYNKKQNIEDLILKIKNNRDKTIKLLFGNEEHLDFFISYISLVAKSKKENPLYLLNYTNSLLSFIGYKDNTFDYYFKNGNAYLSIKFKKKMKGIKEIFYFENELWKELEKIKKVYNDKIYIERISLRRNYNKNTVEGILIIRGVR